ncbi:uncharacterized protein CG45076-like [Thrips palmi]|uniref:Uncharacterized protein CG45076-like n=1 Tax=Thrips palmi TaxID=161013 RepID=A0A6P8ZZN2_THRPL|nr:uncharacterized protein CG45076-like [Thrips palmi]
MVYESDFYTTRRPYSRPTPTISSYSVTTDRETTKAQPLRNNLPFVAHKRLTAPQAPPPRSKVRSSVLMAEIDRINHRVRPHPAYVPTEDWLNSACSVYQLMRKLNYRVDPSETPEPPARIPSQYNEVVPEQSAYWRLRTRVRKGELPLTALATYDIFRLQMAVSDLNFDDETRSIRAQTAALLKRVHSPIPRSRGPLHAVLPTPSSLMETAVPHRHTSDYYIEGLLAPINKVQRDVASRSFYVEHPRPYIGKGNLACVSFAGGKSYAKRRGHYDVPEDHHNVQDDIATLSYYNRARAVANGQEPGPEPAAASTRKSRPYRSTTDSAPAPKADAAPAAPAPRPAAEPIRTASVKEEPAAEAAAEAELAAETQAVPVTNGVSAEEDEAAKLAAEEAELERQLEAELRAEAEAKEAKKAKKAAAKKAKDDEEAKKAAEEAEAKRQAEEAAVKKAEEEAAAAAAAAEEEAEIERQVAAELEAEAKKAAEEALAAAAAEPAEEVSNEETTEAEAEAEAEAAPEAEADAEPEVAAAEEAEPEPEPTPEPADEPEPEPEPEVAAAEAEPETAASPEPEAIAEDPVVEEPESEAVEAEEAKSDEDAGWPLDEE